MVARTIYVLDSEALTVIYSTRQQVGDTIINNSDSLNGTQYTFSDGFSPRQVVVEDAGGGAGTLEDDQHTSHTITDGAGLVENGTQIEAESVIKVQELDDNGAPTGPIINLYVLSKGNVTGDIWGFASDTLLVSRHGLREGRRQQHRHDRLRELSDPLDSDRRRDRRQRHHGC